MNLVVNQILFISFIVFVKRLTYGFFLLIIFLCSIFVSIKGQVSIKVEPNINVSRAYPKRAHFETHLSADPRNPNKLLGCSMIFSAERNAYKSIAYLSVDSGKSWSPTLEVDRDLNLFDPTCMFGLDGKAYFAAFGWEKHPGGKYEMFFYRSNDSGRTWMPPVLIPVLDREYITVDDSGGKYHGRIYVNGTGFTRTANGDYLTDLTLLRSVNGGVSFESPLKLPQGASEAVDSQGNGVVLSDGTLVVLFGHSTAGGADIPRRPTAKLKVLVSNAGAERLGRTYTVGDWYRPNSRWVSTVPVLAVDRTTGVFRDRLYSVWTDNRSGRTEILFSYSSDSGRNWSKPIIVNDDIPRIEGEGPDNFMPAIAVNSSGVIGVSWYDRRDDPENRGWSARFAASLNGGETFTRSVKVSLTSYQTKCMAMVNHSLIEYRSQNAKRKQIDFINFTFLTNILRGIDY